AVELRELVYGSKLREVRYEPVQDLAPELRVGHLPAPEHDRDLDPGPGLQEPGDVALLRGVVVGIDLWPELDLLDLDPGLLAPCFLLPDVALVLVLAVVHDPAHGGLGLRRDLDQVEVELLRAAERVLRRDDPDLG